MLLDEETRRQRGADQDFDAAAFRKRFLDATPLGSIELQIAFGPKGEYGSWLRTHHAVARINGILFVHGGISPSVAAARMRGHQRADRQGTGIVVGLTHLLAGRFPDDP